MDIPEGEGAPLADVAELADLVMRAARRLRRANAEELEGLPVNPHQARALRVIERLEQEGPVRMADLAERLHVAPRSATDVVEPLVEGGWVARSPDPADRRARLLSVTDAGLALLVEVRSARARAAVAVFGGMPADVRAELVAGLGPAFGAPLR